MGSFWTYGLLFLLGADPAYVVGARLDVTGFFSLFSRFAFGVTRISKHIHGFQMI